MQAAYRPHQTDGDVKKPGKHPPARIKPDVGKSHGQEKKVRFSELEQHQVVGSGSFGSVRLVRHVHTGHLYALKAIPKAGIKSMRDVKHVVEERVIQEEVDHPFCVRLMGAFQDEASLYLLQEWVPGGELLHQLELEPRFKEAKARFYAANILLSLEFLHSKGIVYRDLKPENLLVDSTGYLKLTDFGLATILGKGRTHRVCGTPCYMAPEVIEEGEMTKAADYWSLGVLIYEMLIGQPPFTSQNDDYEEVFELACSGQFHVPGFVSKEATDIIRGLLQVDPRQRLGSRGALRIKNHSWFGGINWDGLKNKRLKPPRRQTKNVLFHGGSETATANLTHVARFKWDESLWEWTSRTN
ncbi:hypothetical protein BSKO_11264 [Bryopsis sp. KO-2023]|nr:hypothetical protein BSKO_11264 [Bryopsis sp. KO-2023]